METNDTVYRPTGAKTWKSLKKEKSRVLKKKKNKLTYENENQ